MEVCICVPRGTDMSAVKKEFPDIYMDGREDCDQYFVGRSSDDPLLDDDGNEVDWMTDDECVECCGFVEGAIEGADVLIEGNGGWAQSMISRKDFSRLAVSDEGKAAYKATSDRFWLAYERGKATRPSKLNAEVSSEPGK